VPSPARRGGYIADNIMEMNNKNSSTYRKYRGNKIKNFKLAMILVGVSLIVDFFILVMLWRSIINFQRPNWLILTMCFISLLVLMVIFKIFSGRIDEADRKNYFTWGRGAGGELTAMKKLEILGNDYKMVDDIQNDKGNIDLVCVGPSGIFVIEAKAYGGRISWDNGLLQNGKLIEKDLIKQLHAEVYWVRDYLKKNLNHDYFINGILEFENAKVNDSIRGQIENIWVGGRGFAKWVVENRGRMGCLSTEEIDKIYQALVYAKQ
jgi:hypothetical protein